ncbi:MAG: deoxyguanosinetriphosphate triphosphohydrolase [Rhodospirillaceae bacterium]|jgi:dGTPase|nr:deoxyguanosinetriphosphate triphosphohydrolase [Rhodospirillaceae bacterium]MBT3490807.1 deoxyguanosinetriphosphate triphosphohydrolase [Rhodospirillaceae bacterium]MBT3780048.1 deoxyguanosinetriphosphate triphosphohydrolase [Rhodospirillaceae bacterium]MBT3976411.1 deoxyguanosinetriphosphate triphosphohydrolase [Rhodospirillaceae bacterium]MBT4168299.1 deoxyguanosinetriphosphate triphosphohydrolase [Rhodospirillaceae bacterium]
MTSLKMLAPYATDPDKSRGRLFAEPESLTRTAFQRDRDRIIHSAAFRRLQYKTQVFVYHEGDHYRTRLTHSLEVAQIARSICRALGLNEDLAEALALAHDLGHTPFGHAGEDVLNELMAPHGGFDHNAQALRVITLLEHRYADFPGLNLTWETLEGTVKHNGPVLDDPLPLATAEYIAGHDLELSTYAGPEAQVAALADDIAYDNHDIDDGLRAELFPADALAQVPQVAPVLAELRERYKNLSREQLAHETVRRLIGGMVDDVIGESRARLARANAARVEEIRALPGAVIAFSQAMTTAQSELKQFLFEQMYRHPRVNRMTERAGRVVRDLFGLYTAQPEHLPRHRGPNPPDTPRRVADFIAGMTDRFALEEHRRHFGDTT